jgi:ribosomal protein S12 methylthiotransferase accessory factor
MTPSEDFAVQLYNQLVGWRSGIIQEIFELLIPEGEPKVFSYAGSTCDLSQLKPAGTSMTCGGMGFSRKDAMLACLGESVERYCCQFCDEDFWVGTYNKICEKAIDPESIALFSEEQHLERSFPFSVFTHETSVKWVNAHDLTQNQSVYVPACLVYMPYVNEGVEPPITPAISTGLSCECSFEKAVLKGLFEVIERDAFTITWLKGVATAELVEIPKDIQKIFNYGPIKYHVYDMTSECGVFVYMVVSQGNSDSGELITVGIGAGLDPIEVLRKAFLENAQGRLCLIGSIPKRLDWMPEKDFSNVLSFDDHAMVLTRRPKLLGELDFLGAKGKRPFNAGAGERFSGTQAALSACIEKLKSLGMSVIVKDLTTEDIKSLGLCVVRVIIPGMQQLHGIHRLPFLGGKRLEKAETIFSISADEYLSAGQFNHIPHPLP